MRDSVTWDENEWFGEWFAADKFGSFPTGQMNVSWFRSIVKLIIFSFSKPVTHRFRFVHSVCRAPQSDVKPKQRQNDKRNMTAFRSPRSSRNFEGVLVILIVVLLNVTEFVAGDEGVIASGPYTFSEDRRAPKYEEYHIEHVVTQPDALRNFKEVGIHMIGEQQLGRTEADSDLTAASYLQTRRSRRGARGCPATTRSRSTAWPG